MRDESADQNQSSSKQPSDAIGAWLRELYHELKTDTSSGLCRASAVAACLLATASFLHALINMIVSYATGSTQFNISLEGTSFGSTYLSGWTGFAVALLIGVMLISCCVSYVQENKGALKVLGAVLTGLLAISYAVAFLFIGDASINNAVIVPLTNFLGSALLRLSIDAYAVMQKIYETAEIVLLIPYIVLPILIWFSGKARHLFFVSLATVSCVHILFRLVLLIGDNLGGIAWFVIVVLFAIFLLRALAAFEAAEDDSIYTNNRGERVKISFPDKKKRR